MEGFQHITWYLDLVENITIGEKWGYLFLMFYQNKNLQELTQIDRISLVYTISHFTTTQLTCFSNIDMSTSNKYMDQVHSLCWPIFIKSCSQFGMIHILSLILLYSIFQHIKHIRIKQEWVEGVQTSVPKWRRAKRRIGQPPPHQDFYVT